MLPGVLIFTFDNLPGSRNPREKGGVERFSLRLADSLSDEFRFFFAYKQEVDPKHYIRGDLDVVKVGAVGLRKYIRDNGISIVHLQQYQKQTLQFFRDALAGTGCTVIATYHFRPYTDIQEYTSDGCLRRMRWELSLGRKLKWLKRLALLPHYRKKRAAEMLCKFSLLGELCSSVVFLSPSYLPLADSLAGLPLLVKSRVIPNPLSYDRLLPREEIPGKENTVLVVSRLEEAAKRVSAILRIWSQVERRGFDSWNLVILGDGYSRRSYEKSAAVMGLRRVSFKGFQEPLPYYEKAAVFMSCSPVEGFPLSVLEAMQNAVIPVVASDVEVFPDIFTHGESGLLYRYSDLDGCLEGLVSLMEDRGKREKMAEAALRQSENFRAERIMGMYASLYREFLPEEKAE